MPYRTAHHVGLMPDTKFVHYTRTLAGMTRVDAASEAIYGRSGPWERGEMATPAQALEYSLAAAAHASDTRDASVMTALATTPKDYAGRMENLAFLSLTAAERYEASGRAARDELQRRMHNRLLTLSQFSDVRDYERMLILHNRISDAPPVSPDCKARGWFLPMAMTHL